MCKTPVAKTATWLYFWQCLDYFFFLIWYSANTQSFNTVLCRTRNGRLTIVPQNWMRHVVPRLSRTWNTTNRETWIADWLQETSKCLNQHKWLHWFAHNQDKILPCHQTKRLGGERDFSQPFHRTIHFLSGGQKRKHITVHAQPINVWHWEHCAELTLPESHILGMISNTTSQRNQCNATNWR